MDLKNCAGETSPIKRQKLDEDGFVCPKTPSMPRLTPQFEMAEDFHVSNDGASNSVPFTNYCMEDGDYMQFKRNPGVSGSSKEAEANITVQHGGGDPQQSMNKSIEDPDNLLSTSQGSKSPSVVSVPDEDEDRSGDINTDIGSMIAGMGEQAKKFQDLWSDSFIGSKNFELMLPARLDKILQDALRFEQHLIQQKQRLKHRLNLLGNTLQQD